MTWKVESNAYYIVSQHNLGFGEILPPKVCNPKIVKTKMNIVISMAC